MIGLAVLVGFLVAIIIVRSGALEIVPEFGGLLYDDADGLTQAIERWDDCEFALDPHALQAYAARFSEGEFARQMLPILFETNVDRDVPHASRGLSARR